MKLIKKTLDNEIVKYDFEFVYVKIDKIIYRVQCFINKENNSLIEYEIRNYQNAKTLNTYSVMKCVTDIELFNKIKQCVIENNINVVSREIFEIKDCIDKYVILHEDKKYLVIHSYDRKTNQHLYYQIRKMFNDKNIHVEKTSDIFNQIINFVEKIK